MRAPDLARLCEDLGFGAEAAAAYGAKFAEHGLDGWVAAEVDDWEDYAEVGLSRDHATVLCCVARAARGRAAAGAPAAPAAAPALSDAERAALAAADRAAAETGEGLTSRAPRPPPKRRRPSMRARPGRGPSAPPPPTNSSSPTRP